MVGVTSTKGYQFGSLSSAVIGACIDVQRELGRHCMEVDYQRALELALQPLGVRRFVNSAAARSSVTRWGAP